MRSGLFRGTALCVALLICLCLPAYAGQSEEKRDPIDIWLEKAMEKDSSTHGMRAAIREAARKWDAEMNRVYGRLMKRLKGPKRDALQKAQRAWLKFRDAETAASFEIIGRQEGTMWLLVSEGHCLEIVKRRTLQLRGYESDLDNG
jgi:uncharacterized protein YecT (DUF1311 family)